MTGETDQGKRQQQRDSLFLSANVIVGDSDVFVTRVRNLSSGGMMIDVGIDPEPGTPVVVDLRGIGRIDGRIAWSSPGRAGVAFTRDVDPKLARAPVGGAGAKVGLPDYLKTVPGKRPGLSVR